MGRIIGIDYGLKKCGLSATDPLQIIVNPLDTVATEELIPYLEKYCKQEIVDKIVVGRPVHKDGNETYLVPLIDKFVKDLKLQLPAMVFDFADESFTSAQAKEIIFKSGVKKSKRRDKQLIDRVSAVLILQKYLRHI